MAYRRLLALGCSLAILAALTLLPRTAGAGPPLICWPMEIGDAKSLPWGGDGWKAERADYDTGRLVEDALALLSPDTPVLVRMETLRRATIYAHQDARIANELLARVKARAFDSETKGRPDANAYFDAGYLVACYGQMSPISRLKTWVNGPDGYDWVMKGIRLSGGNPEMEFAAALIALKGLKKGDPEHLQKALSGATDGSLLAQNLVRQFASRGETMADLCARYGLPKIPSGLDIGQESPAFDPQHVWGPDRGSHACPMCKYGYIQGVLYWVNTDDNWEEVKKWAGFLDQESARRGDERFKAYLIYTNPNLKPLKEVEKQLTRLAQELSLKQIAVTYVPSPTDRATAALNKINPKAKNTIIVYKKRTVFDKFVNFEPSEEDLRRLVASVDRAEKEK